MRLKKFKRGGLVLSLLIAALLVVVPTTGNAAPAMAASPVYKIVALGDSVTAGFEPDMRENPQLTPYGYADRLKEQGWFHGRTELANYGILGLTSEGLAHYIAAVKEGSSITAEGIQPGLADPRIGSFVAGIAEARSDLSAADVIVMTIGGNDLKSVLTDYANLSKELLESKIQSLVSAYTANLKLVLKDLRSLNPQALIVLADQYQPVPKLAAAASYEELWKAAGVFTAAVDDLVNESQADGPVKAAHVAAAFKGYELSYTHIMEKDIHPNQFGYAEIARIFSEAIWGEYRTTTAAKGLAPISVVVSGKELATANAPIVKNNQTFVAIGDIVSAARAAAKWNSKTQTATITYGGRVVVIPIGAKSISVNGSSVATGSPAFLSKTGVNAKTYVPLALLSKGLGFDVQYAGKLKTAFINS